MKLLFKQIKKETDLITATKENVYTDMFIVLTDITITQQRPVLVLFVSYQNDAHCYIQSKSIIS